MGNHINIDNFEEALKAGFGEGFSIDKTAEASLNNVFLNNRQSWVTDAVTGYIQHGIDPNITVEKIASSYVLNEEQIKRIAEDANVNIYLKKYAMTKGKNNRRVEFPLADANMIINKLASQKVATQQVNEQLKTALKGEDSDLAKVASDTSVTLEPINFMNSSVHYEPALWERDSMVKVAADNVKKKLNLRIEEAKQQKLNQLGGLYSKIAMIGDSLIYNEYGGQCAQALLDKLATDLGDTSFERPVINYIEKKANDLKAQGRLPKNFNINLNITDLDYNDFSLGRHSLQKKASDTVVVEVPKLPDKINYNKLVAAAADIKEDLQKGKIQDDQVITVNKI